MKNPIQNWFFQHYLTLLPGVLTIGVVLLLKSVGIFQGLELVLFDRGMRSRPAELPDDRIVVVGIDEEDLRQVGYPISDQTLAELLEKLQEYKPRGIGVDIFRDLPVEPGHEQLRQNLQRMQNVIGIEKAVLPDRDNSVVYPPTVLPKEQVGFVDVLLDQDGNIRRALLSSPGWDGDYRFSLATRLADRYLQKNGITLNNGTRDPHGFQFGSVELPRFSGNQGGYVRSDSGGNQILLNWRRATFTRLTLRDLRSRQFSPSLLFDRIILIGYTAPYSAKDTFLAAPAQKEEIFGVEYHAHTISHILSSVLDSRSSLNILPNPWEYVWIVFWGGIGILFALISRSPFLLYIKTLSGIILLIFIHHGLLWYSWWLPIVPTLFAWMGSALITRNINDFRSFLAQQKLALQQQQLVLEQRQQLIDQQQIVLEQQNLLIEERQSTLEDAFNAMHNGPLHTLAELISILKRDDHKLDVTTMIERLYRLDKELRTVYESLRPENLEKAASIPLHELLYEVYHRTMQRDFACFSSLKVRIPDIYPIDDTELSGETKRELCAFLEEALCNVGKHAEGATRLFVVCKPENGHQVIRIVDNGVGMSPETIGESARGGTKHAHKLARQLQGTFDRRPNQPKGTICELIW